MSADVQQCVDMTTALCSLVTAAVERSRRLLCYSTHDLLPNSTPVLTRPPMSTSTMSRELPAPVNHQMTLAALREQMIADATLTPRQRQDIASALRSLAKALQMPLERIPAHPGYL